ncbi:hypothetical protein [Blastococcus sp. Marseille-P5729]|uniref:hypothetical protein n=1 Tax=Blastococcus sp. Marseille-P5729 TaxID=2086582 RepID=UPI0018FED0BC|nr:hypothetical protein [Blastococcus sp. Marseille-P5729]
MTHDKSNEPIDDNDGQMTDEEAKRIASEQTASASENADKAGKDWEGRDVEPPKPV